MADRTNILDVIFTLRETDRSEGFFRPIVETKNLIWRFEITQVDKLGLLISHIAITARTPPICLERQFDLLKKKITYLEEDFELVEHDRNKEIMILRSTIPQQLEHAINYYEILLAAGNQLSFRRYEFDKIMGKRRVRPANLATDTFGRLLADFESLFS
jgi:hypothetical protein